MSEIYFDITKIKTKMKSLKHSSGSSFSLILLLTFVLILSASIALANVTQSAGGEESALQTSIELDHKEKLGKTLYIQQLDSQDEHFHGGELILESDLENTQISIAQDVLSADLSEDGLLVAAWNTDNQILLFTSEGKEIKRVGLHGASPIISQDKKYIAYNKLSNEGSDLQELSEKSPYGIAIYDLVTNKEDVITNSSDDFQPVGFSKDMTKLYFNSTRAYANAKKSYSNHVASLWMVELATKKVTRLTNTNEELVMKGVMVPIIDVRALWSSDGRTVISSTDMDSGVWQYKFNDDGTLLSAKKIGSGTSPKWSEMDKKINISSKVNGQITSQELSIK